MMSEWIMVALVITGGAFLLLASIGIIRMPDLYSRIQAATKAATLGVGCIILALVPGASYLEVKVSSTFLGIGGKTSRGFNFSAQAILGYQKSFGVFSMFIQARYMYIKGMQSYFHSVAGECGFGFNAW